MFEYNELDEIKPLPYITLEFHSASQISYQGISLRTHGNARHV